VFEAAVDRFGRSVPGAGPIEVGKHVGGPAFERSPECDQLGQALMPVMAFAEARSGLR